jgi:Zn-dependent peptidase ImmA (M78 family)
MLDKFANRLRFSMAHELGHYFLHREVYSNLSLNSIEDWKEFILNVPEPEYEAFECQANEFAGRFLAPYDKLNSAVAESIERIRKGGMEHLLSDEDMVLAGISPFLRRIFGVSEQVIEIRVRREKLWPLDG